MKKLILPIAAIALGATPVVATAADAQRSSQPADEVSEAGGTATIVAIIAAAAVIIGIIAATEDDDDDQPVSV
ncbi:hypothetical protein [Qipengyuania aquimaris]|uniref:Ferrochelatase n=1 Tax=Qipengyuania aquimaris TaxID=255984 RepID=A0A9Q3S0C4_9SPHN|nr:hypothetical protein [Qipengyuania aquimaris]MBY6217874.1 hypothetical protein [Qipengyuania aquimaris]